MGDSHNWTVSAHDRGHSKLKGKDRGCQLSDQNLEGCLKDEALDLIKGVGTFSPGQVEPRERTGRHKPGGGG